MKLLWDGPADSAARLVLAPGAGAPMTSDWMSQVAAALGQAGLRVARFDFPYMRAGRKVPDKEPVLRQTWLEVIEHLGDAGKLFIGGKSMGGRIATMVADEARVAGLLCLGYPFHPPGRPEKLRTAHLENLKTPCLICQGTRDAFGNREEVQGYRLAPTIRWHWVEPGDHSLECPVRSGVSWTQTLQGLGEQIRGFLLSAPFQPPVLS